MTAVAPAPPSPEQAPATPPRPASPSTDQQQQQQQKSGVMRSPNQPKLRRKAPIADTLQETTAVQRLVEYFCVVSSQPRWEREPRNVDASQPEPQNKKNSKCPRRRKKAAEPHEERPETRQATESPSNSAEENRTAGNIHMPDSYGYDYTFEPQITARFPLVDYDDNPLNPMVTHFCYPSGDIIVPSKTYQLPRVHHFVLTNDRGRKVYSTCLTIFEEWTSQGPWKSQTMTHDEDVTSGDGIEVSVDNRGKALYLPKVLCLLSTWPYLTAFREYLAQLYRLASTTNVMCVPLERYVMNLCLEIPAPPPGAFEVQVPILTSVIRFWAPPAKLPIAYVALPYQILFECLDVENILSLWTAVIMERKILLLSSQYSILTVCSEILCSLLFPMRWSHLYVPLLPRMLCPMLDAPMPYLCGIVRENWLHAQQFVAEDTIIVDLDRNSVIFGALTPKVPPLPPRKFLKLQTTLTETVGHVFWKTRGLEKEYQAMMHKKAHKRSFEKLRQMQSNGGQWVEKLGGLDHAFNLAYTPDSANLLREKLSGDEQSQWDRVQEGFLRFFVAVLKNYRKYLVIPSVPDSLHDAADAGPVQTTQKPSFDRIAFIASQKVEVAPFLLEMCMTQHFDDFITKRLYSPGEPDLIFFDQSIDAKLNRSKLKLKKVDTPFLQSAKAHKVLKKLNAVEPNQGGLPKREIKPYIYKIFPSTFDERLFYKPRPIPQMIAAEFDRQAILVSRLRSTIVDDEEEEDDMLEFYGGDYDPSPEVASFTVFFFVYSALIGREWQDYERKRRVEETKWRELKSDTSEEQEQRDVVTKDITQQQGIEVTEGDRDTADLCLADLSMGLCDQCPENGYATFKSALQCFEEEAGAAYKKLFKRPMDHVAEFQRQLNVSQSDRFLTVPVTDDGMVEYEEARQVVGAQLDLAFETLSTMSLRGLSADSDVYKSLMESCGRCGDTQRALKLIELMKKDGFVADSEVLSCFVASFAHDGVGGVEVGGHSTVNASYRGSDAYSTYLQKRLEAAKEGEEAYEISHLSSHDESALSEATSGEASGATSTTGSAFSSSHDHGGAAFLDWFTHHPVPKKKKKKHRRRRRRTSITAPGMPVTDMVSKQLTLGESLLDYLYPDLAIDTNSDSCPQCSDVLSESDIVEGWLPCAFADYTTKCPKCQHRFVPRFTVTCSSSTFEGSQGPRTPLYCEFLSPWVIRKELQKVIKGETGIEGMILPEWRSGADIRATLFWNLMVLCRRYRLPFSFLLQGNFQNRLILPRKPDEM